MSDEAQLPTLIQQILEPDVPAAEQPSEQSPVEGAKEAPTGRVEAPAGRVEEEEQHPPITDDNISAALELFARDDLVALGFDAAELDELDLEDPDLQDVNADPLLQLLIEDEAKFADPMAALKDLV